MSIFSKLFGQQKNNIQCPRCLGKGKVDQNDIKRLNRELKWKPSRCAYCNGKGKVDASMPDKVPVDMSYLTVELPPEERQKLIRQDNDALERAYLMDARYDSAIHEIVYLHFICHLDAGKIADFFLLHSAADLQEHGNYEEEKEDMIDYVNKVIAMKKNSGLN